MLTSLLNQSAGVPAVSGTATSSQSAQVTASAGVESISGTLTSVQTGQVVSVAGAELFGASSAVLQAAQSGSGTAKLAFAATGSALQGEQSSQSDSVLRFIASGASATSQSQLVTSSLEFAADSAGEQSQTTSASGEQEFRASALSEQLQSTSIQCSHLFIGEASSGQTPQAAVGGDAANYASVASTQAEQWISVTATHKAVITGGGRPRTSKGPIQRGYRPADVVAHASSAQSHQRCISESIQSISCTGTSAQRRATARGRAVLTMTGDVISRSPVQAIASRGDAEDIELAMLAAVLAA